MKEMDIVIDASVLLKAYFKDELGHEAAQELMKSYASGECNFLAPSLITYEIINACIVANRRGRIELELVRELLDEMLSLDIAKKDVGHLSERIWEFSMRYGVSAYDGSYLALAEEQKCELMTGDKRLHNAVSKDLKWIVLI